MTVIKQNMYLLLVLILVILGHRRTECHPFKLKSQLNSNVLNKLAEAQIILTKKLVQEDTKFAKLTAPNVIVLQPLYFHLDDYFIYANNMRLTHGEFVVEENNLDVLGHEMMPEVYFPWVEIKGKLKCGKSDSLPERFDFRLIQNDLKGKGIMSLSVDLLNVTWAYFFFHPNSTSLQIRDDSEDGNTTKTTPAFNVTLVGELIGKKVQRDVSQELTRIVSGKINQTLKETAQTSDLQTVYEEISEVGANNTDSANSFIDSLLEVGSELIKTKYEDKIKIPDINEWFSEKFVIKFRGSFRATQGSVKGISSIYRVGDTVLGYDNETLLHFYGVLGFKELQLEYNHYKAEIWGWGPSGSMKTSFAPVSTVVLVHLNLTSKMISLEKFKIANVGEMEVKLTGLGGVVDWLVSRVTTWVMGLFRDRIIHQLESQYEKYGKDIFAAYNIEDLLGSDLKDNFNL